jgi:hypothetical protein
MDGCLSGDIEDFAIRTSTPFWFNTWCYGLGCNIVWKLVTSSLHSRKSECDPVYQRSFGASFVTIPSKVFLSKTTPHVARVTQRLFNDNNVNLLPWPASSPDLSPIEHVWHMIGRRVEDFPAPIGTLAELRVQIQRAWDEIPQSYSCARRYSLSSERLMT